jgi:hypothetical protein
MQKRQTLLLSSFMARRAVSVRIHAVLASRNRQTAHLILHFVNIGLERGFGNYFAFAIAEQGKMKRNTFKQVRLPVLA